MLVALHVHTNHSACSESEISHIAQYCRKRGIEAIAITDHNQIEGAFELQDIAPELKVIVSEEISTREGEIIGLFLEERIPAGKDIRETCIEIKNQGGLVYLPHPFDSLKVHRVRSWNLQKILDLVDIIEVYNAKASFPLYNRKAREFAEAHGIRGAVASDSHYVKSIGSALMSMEPFEGAADFLEKLSRAQFLMGASSLIATWWIRVRKLARISR